MKIWIVASNLKKIELWMPAEYRDPLDRLVIATPRQIECNQEDSAEYFLDNYENDFIRINGYVYLHQFSQSGWTRITL